MKLEKDLFSDFCKNHKVVEMYVNVAVDSGIEQIKKQYMQCLLRTGYEINLCDTLATTQIKDAMEQNSYNTLAFCIYKDNLQLKVSPIFRTKPNEQLCRILACK